MVYPDLKVCRKLRQGTFQFKTLLVVIPSPQALPPPQMDSKVVLFESLLCTSWDAAFQDLFCAQMEQTKCSIGTSLFAVFKAFAFLEPLLGSLLAHLEE